MKILWRTITKVFKRESVGIEKSGIYSFYDYRRAEWVEQGRQDLIEKAQAEENAIRNKLKKNHRN